MPTTPNTLTQENLDYARSLLQQSPSTAYNYLTLQGYRYATLADGVAQGNTFSGLMALEFMRNTAQVQGRTVSESEMDAIKQEMANKYLDQLQKQIDSTGVASREITADEAWAFHNQVFNAHGLPADTWTLNTPFELSDQVGREDYWQKVLNTAGDPLSEALLALGTQQAMAFERAVGDSTSAQKAGAWLDRLDNLGAIANVPAALGIWLNEQASQLGNANLAATGSPAWAAIADGLVRMLGDSAFGYSFLADLLAGQGINPDILRLFESSRNWVAPPPRRRDPLVLDLDGDGIETIGLNGATSILFDHDADGIKTASGWVKGDDALLVLDRNGNGAIDSGAELFGDTTPLSGGGLAADGFAALRDFDANADGVFNAQDAGYADVRLWRDLDQDGVSDAGELMSLTDAGIASINLNASATNIDLGNGNRQMLGGSFERTNGSSGSVGNLTLAANAFYREFATPIALTGEAQGLPDIQGAGQVRDLREAASLSAALAATAAGINGSLSPAQMRGQVDALLGQWADTSTMQGGIEQAAARNVRQMESRRWRYGERREIGHAENASNSAVFGMKSEWMKHMLTQSRLTQQIANLGWKIAA